MLRIFSTIIKLIFRKAFPKNISKSILLNFKPRTFNQVNFIPRRFHYNPLISVADQRSYFSILFYGILIQEVKQMPNVYLNIAIWRNGRNRLDVILKIKNTMRKTSMMEFTLAYVTQWDLPFGLTKMVFTKKLQDALKGNGRERVLPTEMKLGRDYFVTKVLLLDSFESYCL